MPVTRSLQLFLICLAAVLSYGRTWLIQDIIWDDNCWLLSAYATDSLRAFLETGFIELRREAVGTFLYYLFSLHKSGNYFPVWHGLNALTLLGTPLLLYFFVRNLFNGNSLLAFFAAISLIAFPLDYTLPYASDINYRFSLLLAIFSLLLLERALRTTAISPWLLAGSLASGVAAYLIFMEGAVAFEPARALIIGYLLHARGLRRKPLYARTLALWSPFLALAILYMAYKLLFKTHGIYTQIYAADFPALFHWKELGKTIAHLLFYQWFVLLREARFFSPVSYLLGAAGAFLFFTVLWGRLARKEEPAQARLAHKHPVGTLSSNDVRLAVGLAVALLLPQALMFLLFSRPFAWGMNSSHAILAQAGYAVGGGLLLTLVVTRAASRPALRLLCAMAIGAGIFMNNANLDMYFESWKAQTRFWEHFRERFPVLPERATFFFDVRDERLYTDLRNYYDFEFQMNLLYDAGGPPSRFRKYRAYTITELHETPGRTPESLIQAAVIERRSHLANDALEPRDFIVVHYRNGRLRVGEEILRDYPDIAYRSWLEKPSSRQPK